MSVEFAQSERATLGVEWELALVDPATGDLSQRGNDIIAEFNRLQGDGEPLLQNELMLNTVEIATGVCRTVGEAMDDLARSVRKIQEVARRHGVDIACMGLHPTAKGELQSFTDKERYTVLLEELQLWAKQLLIWGIHIHVGVDSEDRAVPIMNALLPYSAHFQALSASSPFWRGHDTGYASNRAMLFQQLPTAGSPPNIRTWEEFTSCVDSMRQAGCIREIDEIRWDIRPAPKYGTVEIRICDGLPTLEEIGAVTALAQCLVADINATMDRGEELPTLPEWFIWENKWRAARYGMEMELIRNSAGDQVALSDHLLETVDRLMPHAEELGCAEELAHIRTIVREGSPYHRQRAMINEGSSYPEVVLTAAKELKDSVERNAARRPLT